jgi:excinuclease UvrABC ATPase subunit
MIEDLKTPNFITGNVIRSHTVILCTSCNGLGYVKSNIMIDPRKRQYETANNACNTCSGDGRMIEIRTTYIVNTPSEKIVSVPYVDSSKNIQPYHEESIWFRMRPDNRNIDLERKYSDLADIAYHKYDELVRVYAAVDILSNKKIDEENTK